MSLPLFDGWNDHKQWKLHWCYTIMVSNQGSQFRTRDYTDLTNRTIYFDTNQYSYTVSSLPLLYIYIIINIKVYYKTLPQFRTNYL